MNTRGGGGGRLARALHALPPPPPRLPEIGRGVPDHWCQRGGEEISLDVAEAKKLGFHPMCLYSIHSEFPGEFNDGHKWAFFQLAQNRYRIPEQWLAEMATFLVGSTLDLHLKSPGFNCWGCQISATGQEGWTDLCLRRVPPYPPGGGGGWVGLWPVGAWVTLVLGNLAQSAYSPPGGGIGSGWVGGWVGGWVRNLDGE